MLTEVFMKVIKIEIQNYKSIKEPVEINLYDGLPTVLIGKNGSGKTNVLEALSAIAEANGNYFGQHRELPMSYKVHIRLEKEDAERLFPGKSIDEEYEFAACSGEDCKINRIESKYLVPLLRSEIDKISELASQLKDELDTYKKQLHEIAYSEHNEQPLRGYQITDFHDSTTNYDSLKFQAEFVLEQAKKMTESLLRNFCIEDCSFKFGYIPDYYQLDNLERLRFKLRFVKPDLAPFEEKFITVNEAAIKREITKINNATRASCEKITALLHELDERAKRLKAAMSDDQIIPDNSGVFYKFICELRKCVSAKCTFLRNESSEVIFKKDEREREYFPGDKSRIILQTYLNRVCTGSDKNEIQKQISENKDFPLPKSTLNEFEEYLNTTMPEFENGMYDSISVEQSDGKLPSILLHEKSGEVVDLNSTSAGRRWYFTYYFMKNTLENGDLFIIDEPAAMLHPVAQKEVLKELLQLESQGIKVIYSTHSPYLIPSDWKSVHFVAMTGGGTAVTQENNYKLLKEVIGGDIFDLQELLERYQKCGAVGAAHNCCKALMHKYGSIEEVAKNVPFSYDTIEAWKKKKRGTSFENVIKIAKTIEVLPNELL